MARISDRPPKQLVTFHDFEGTDLAKLLDLETPPLATRVPKQLRSISEHLQKLGCKSFAVEHHYVDRDYMEEHAMFYSKSLCSYENYCLRAHFFKSDKLKIEGELASLVTSTYANGAEQYRQECRAFSEREYLGFMVVKPLPGCPVGRTVLRSLIEDGGQRFDCLRTYTAHFAGAELDVRGLAFQQQDIGVSACATTAIWSAFQKVRDFEEVAPASPAQITMLAARYTLPFGRPMPSEGLSTDQMCMAIQALGASPQLLRAQDYETARGYLYSINISGMSCILIMRKCSSQSEHHAVSVVGIRCRKDHIPQTPKTGADDLASDLEALYIHDDRLGPYVVAKIERGNGNRLVLQLEIRKPDGAVWDNLGDERWELEQILLPMHAKVRLSFGELWRIVVEHLVSAANGIRAGVLRLPIGEDVKYKVRVIPVKTYIEDLLLGGYSVSKNLVYEITKTVAFSRYIGIVRLSAPFMETVDIILDTTSTVNNPIFLTVIPLGTSDACQKMARELGLKLMRSNPAPSPRNP